MPSLDRTGNRERVANEGDFCPTCGWIYVDWRRPTGRSCSGCGRREPEIHVHAVTVDGDEIWIARSDLLQAGRR